MRQSLPWNRMRRSWRRCALGMCLLVLSGCAAREIRVVCQVAPPPAPLMEPPPAETFRSRLDAILQSSFTASPTTPTGKP